MYAEKQEMYATEAKAEH